VLLLMVGIPLGTFVVIQLLRLVDLAVGRWGIAAMVGFALWLVALTCLLHRLLEKPQNRA
jgi:hypothetical protein